MSDDRFRGLKAILKNALLWGVTLGVVSGTLITAYVVVVPGPGVESLPERLGEALFAGIGMGVRFALAGAVIGTFFATALRFIARGRRVADLHLGKAALIGGVVGGVGIPLFYQLLNILSGGPIPWNLLTDDIGWATIFGASAAAGTIWLARRAHALPEEERRRALEAGSLEEELSRTKVAPIEKADR